MSWPTVVASLIAAIFGAGGSVAIVTSLARRRVTRVEAADKLNDSTLEWAIELKADAAGLRAEVAEARRENADLRREIWVIRQEAEALGRDLRRLRIAIMDPYATLDRLRAMVGDQGNNGTSTSQPV
jgi:hypothetical protein